VQAGWIKLSAGDDGLTPTETKILRAAARAAKATGSVIGSHTIGGLVVRDQLDILDRGSESQIGTFFGYDFSSVRLHSQEFRIILMK
jgi:hypothetical protein